MDPSESKFKPQPAMRELPHNTEAEQSLLGAILLNNECFEDVSDILAPSHFYVPVHGQIFEAISTLINQDLVADPITLRAYFEKNKDLQKIDGGGYLVRLVNSVISLAGVADYAKVIYDTYLRRRLIIIGEDISHSAADFNLNISSTDQIETAESRLYDLAVNNTRGASLNFATVSQQALATIEQAYKSENKIIGVTTGFIDLNKKLGGLNRSDLIILAGRPSMGKTALATNMAFKAAMDKLLGRAGGGTVGFFSLEMSSEQLVSRILSQESRVQSERIRRGEIREEEFGQIVSISRKLSDLPLYIDDTPGLTVSSLRTKARQLQRKNGLELIVIDYLQLMQGSPDHRTDNRVLEISEITRSLKGLAKELNIPIIALSQLSRAVEVRDDKRPQLADLRESGSIEQDADVVMFVFREEYYLERTKPDESAPEFQKWLTKMQGAHNKAEIIIAKQRHGPIGTVPLFFDGQFTKFDNLMQEMSREQLQ